MKQKFKKYSLEIVKFLVILTIFANIVSYYKSSDLNKNQLQLNSITLLDDIEYKLPNNKPILIHFWATWCPVCKVEAPNIQTLSEDYEVITIAVGSGDDDTIKEYLKENSLNFNVINDYDSQLAKKFNITVYPTTLIYDNKKNLLFSEVGYTSTIGLYLRMWWASF